MSAQASVRGCAARIHTRALRHEQQANRLYEIGRRRFSEFQSAQCLIDQLIGTRTSRRADAQEIFNSAALRNPEHGNKTVVIRPRFVQPAQGVEHILLDKRIIASMRSRHRLPRFVLRPGREDEGAFGDEAGNQAGPRQEPLQSLGWRQPPLHVGRDSPVRETAFVKRLISRGIAVAAERRGERLRPDREIDDRLAP
ncbi:hypothetical protein [Bradyrhizobium sp. Leo170]|uniref:hypothetical protein n=1 Tax=Bradyrhizobium sp. Leo170 TaxID=1571199 RepID=UPI00102E7540|nr:hypothetical protein [Bradyrhizobium sp. Leo170]